jgi:DNA-binding MarR family transcriptional regulator
VGTSYDRYMSTPTPARPGVDPDAPPPLFQPPVEPAMRSLPDPDAVAKLQAAAKDADRAGLPERLRAHPMFVMLQLLRFARRSGNAEPSPGNLRLPHYGVLSVLCDDGPASQREVADRLHLDASDLVGIVDGLEAGGYLTRVRDEADRRRYILTATPAGRDVLAEVERHSRDTRARFLAPLSEAERATLTDLLARLHAHHEGMPPP